MTLYLANPSFCLDTVNKKGLVRKKDIYVIFYAYSYNKAKNY